MSIRNIEKFDGTHFLLWKNQMKKILISLDLEGIVLGTETEPTNPTEIKKRQKNNARAIIILASSMTREQYANVVTCDTANAMWTIVRNLRRKLRDK